MEDKLETKQKLSNRIFGGLMAAGGITGAVLLGISPHHHTEGILEIATGVAYVYEAALITIGSGDLASGKNFYLIKKARDYMLNNPDYEKVMENPKGKMEEWVY